MPNQGSPEIRLRAQIEAMGGRIVRSRASLLREFGFRPSNQQAVSDVEARLSAVGVGTEPPLGEETSPAVTLYLLESERPSRTDNPPTSATEAMVTAAAQSASFAAVATGVIAAGLVFTVLGFARHWIYGLLFLLLTLATLGFIRWRPFSLWRFFAPRLSFLRLGWVLGLVSMLLVALVASLLVVAPVAAIRAAEAREDEAAAYLASAREALDEGDLTEARENLTRARESDDEIAGLEETETRLDMAVAERQEEERNAQRYKAAKRSFASDDYSTAINGMEALGTYRDAERLANSYERTAAQETLDRARDVLEDDPARALQLVRVAQGYRETAAATTVADAAREIQAAQAAAAELAREQRQAERQAAAEAEAEAAAEEAEAAAEAAEPTAPSGGGGGSGGFNCGPGDIDGDGDGLCNE